MQTKGGKFLALATLGILMFPLLAGAAAASAANQEPKELILEAISTEECAALVAEHAAHLASTDVQCFGADDKVFFCNTASPLPLPYGAAVECFGMRVGYVFCYWYLGPLVCPYEGGYFGYWFCAWAVLRFCL